MHGMNKVQVGYLQILLSAATFAFSSVVAKWAYNLGFTPYSFSLGTSLIAVAVLAPLLRGRRWRPPAGAGTATLLAYGLTGAGSGLLFNLTLAYLDVSLATLLIFTYPAAVALGAWLAFGQRPTPTQAAAIALTVLGAGLTAGPVRGGVQAIGIALALATLVMHSAYMLLGERLLAEWDPRAATAYTRLMNAALALALAPAAAAGLAGLDAPGWAFLVFGALTAALLPFLFLLEGIAKVGASRAAIVSAAELPAALLLGWLLMGDRLTGLQGLGAVLIVGAVLLIQRQERAALAPS